MACPWFSAETLADDLSSGKLKDEDVEARLLSDLKMNPGVGAIAAAYSPRFVPEFALSNGLVRYEMVSLTGSNTRPDLKLFAPPPETEAAEQ